MARKKIRGGNETRNKKASDAVALVEEVKR